MALATPVLWCKRPTGTQKDESEDCNADCMV